MSINTFWSSTQNGAAFPSYIDHGNISNGQTTTPVNVWLRHNGANSITSVGLYIREFSATYSGAATISQDLLEILGWGSAASSVTFGGFQNSFTATTSFWAGTPTYTSPDISGVYTYRTGVGDSESNAITLPGTTGSGGDGIITAGNTATHFQSRIVVPTATSVLGIRQFDQTLRYNFTT